MTQVTLLNSLPRSGDGEPVDVWLGADPPDGSTPDFLFRLEAGTVRHVYVTPGSRIIVACPDDQGATALPATIPADGDAAALQLARD